MNNVLFKKRKNELFQTIDIRVGALKQLNILSSVLTMNDLYLRNYRFLLYKILNVSLTTQYNRLHKITEMEIFYISSAVNKYFMSSLTTKMHVSTFPLAARVLALCY